MLIKKLKENINKKFNYIVNRQNSSMQASFSYMQLSKLFHEDVFIPMTSWTISPNLILHVLNDIEINDKKCIVEFGAGASTVYIAKLLKMHHPDTVFYSIESDASWAEKISKQLESLKLSDHVTIILAPTEEIQQGLAHKTQKFWYSTSILNKKLAAVTNIDLVLVDGPSGGLSPYSRYSAAPFLKDKLADNFSIYLDDAKRIHEKEIAKEWKKSLNCNIRSIEDYIMLSTKSSHSILPHKI